MLKSLLRWAGHISRMGSVHRFPKISLYGELSTGHRGRLAPKKGFKDFLKKTLNTCYIDQHQWSTPAANLQAWGYTVHQVICTFVNSSKANLRDKRHGKKILGASANIPDLIISLTANPAAGLACPASAYSAVSMPAIDVDSLLHNLRSWTLANK